MYEAKELINKMKKSIQIKTNTELSEHLGVSYNTLNTWIKRNKLPQEIIINFSSKYSISLDYLLTSKTDNNNNNLFSAYTEKDSILNTIDTNKEITKYTYYGEYEALNISYGTVLELNSALLHSNGHYLLKHNNIFFINKVMIDVFSNNVTLDTKPNNKTMELTEFNSINMGLIVKINH